MWFFLKEQDFLKVSFLGEEIVLFFFPPIKLSIWNNSKRPIGGGVAGKMIVVMGGTLGITQILVLHLYKNVYTIWYMTLSGREKGDCESISLCPKIVQH